MTVKEGEVKYVYYEGFAMHGLSLHDVATILNQIGYTIVDYGNASDQGKDAKYLTVGKINK